MDQKTAKIVSIAIIFILIITPLLILNNVQNIIQQDQSFPQSPSEKEILNIYKRGTRGDGQGPFVISNKHKNEYWNETTQNWQEINITAIYNTTWNGYAWTNPEMQYRPYFLEYIDTGYVYEFQTNRSYTDTYNVFRYLTQDMGYVNDLGSWEYLATREHSRGWVHNNIIQYNDTFITTQSNTTYIYNIESHKLREEKILYALPESPNPSMGDKSQIRLAYSGKIEKGDCDIWLDMDGDDEVDTLFNNNNNIDNIRGKIVCVNDTNATQFVLSKPYATDLNGNSTLNNETYNVTYHIKNQGQSFFFWKEIPLLWLENATFPVIIDPTVIDGTASSFIATVPRGLMQDSNGYYYAFYSETSSLNIARTTNPNDITAWDTTIPLIGDSGILDSSFSSNLEGNCVLRDDIIYLVFKNNTDSNRYLYFSYCVDLDYYDSVDGWTGIEDTSIITENIGIAGSTINAYLHWPLIDVDSEGRIFVIKKESGTNDLYIIRYLPGIGWDSPLLIDDTVTANYYRIVIDDSDYIYFIYCDSGASPDILYFVKSTNHGDDYGTLADPTDGGRDVITMDFGAGGSNNQRADIFVNLTGDVMVIWTELYDTSYTSIHYNTTYNTNWQTGGTVIEVASEHNCHPILTGVDGDNNMYCFYAGTSEIVYKKWDGINENWDSEQAFNSDASDSLRFPSAQYPLNILSSVGVCMYLNDTDNMLLIDDFTIYGGPLAEAVDDDSNIDGVGNIGTADSTYMLATTNNTIYQNIQENNTSEDFESYVDNDDSDVDSGGSYGSHSNFENEKIKDGTYDTLTEENNPTSGVDEFRYVDSYSDVDWGEVGSPEYIDIQDEPTNYITDGKDNDVTGWCTFADTSGTGSGFTVTLDAYHECPSGDSYPDWELDWTGDGSADASGSFNFQSSYAWDSTGTVSGLDTDTEINSCRVRLTHNKGSGGSDDIYVDAVRLYITQPGTDNYRLDLEVQFTGANNTQDNEYLCIYAGTQDAEALGVEVWDGSWNQVIADLTANDWNNVSILSYLTTSTLTIRFLDDTQTSDTSQGSWEIDYVGLHCWNNSNYELQWEHQCQDVVAGADEYKICIWGYVDNAENMEIQVWTGSTWSTALTTQISTNLEWYNNTISNSYVIDNNITWRYRGTSESSDTTLTTLKIDWAGYNYTVSEETPENPEFVIKDDGNNTRDGVWGSEPFRYSNSIVPSGQDILSTDWFYGFGNSSYYFNFTITDGDLINQQYGLWRVGGSNTSIEKLDCSNGAWRIYVYYTQNINDKVTGHESGHPSNAYGNCSVTGLTPAENYWFKAEIDVQEDVLLLSAGQYYRGNVTLYATN